MAHPCNTEVLHGFCLVYAQWTGTMPAQPVAGGGRPILPTPLHADHPVRIRAPIALCHAIACPTCSHQPFNLCHAIAHIVPRLARLGSPCPLHPSREAGQGCGAAPPPSPSPSQGLSNNVAAGKLAVGPSRFGGSARWTIAGEPALRCPHIRHHPFALCHGIAQPISQYATHPACQAPIVFVRSCIGGWCERNCRPGVGSVHLPPLSIPPPPACIPFPFPLALPPALRQRVQWTAHGAGWTSGGEEESA